MATKEIRYQIKDYEREYSTLMNGFQKRDISPINKQLILDFNKHLTLTGSAHLLRRMKYMRILTKCSELLDKDFDKVNRKDIEELVYKIATNNDWEESTKRDYRVFVKRFYKWLKGDDKEYPEIVRWIKTTGEHEIKLRQEDLITELELEKLLAVAESQRDRAFISVLFESGTRISEIGTLRIRDISIDKYGIQIHVLGKTGSRVLRLVNSVGELTQWMYMHPEKNNKDAPLWCRFNQSNKCLSYSMFRKILQKYFRKAEIKKKCNPHLFRHGACTRLSKHLSDQVLKQYCGWSQNSNMPATYVHLSGADTDNAILEMNGVVKDDTQIDNKIVFCPRCKAPNNKEAKYCYNCSQVLDISLAQQMKEGQDIETRIRANPEAVILMQKLAEVLSRNQS